MPRTEQAPAFQVYAAEELADAQQMTDDEFGKFNRLRALAWRDGGLPTDPARLAVTLGVKPKDFARLWAVVGAPFVERDGRYVLPPLETQRQRQAERRDRNAQNGQRGGRPPAPKNPPGSPNGTHEATQKEPSGLAKPNPDERLVVAVAVASTPAASPPSPARAELLEALPPDYAADVDTLLTRVPPDSQTAWLRKLLGTIRPTSGGAARRPADVGEAIRDFNANGADPRWKLFAGYLREVGPPPPTLAMVPATNGQHSPAPNGGLNGTNGHRPTRTDRVVERSIQGTAAALAALKGRVR